MVIVHDRTRRHRYILSSSGQCLHLHTADCLWAKPSRMHPKTSLRTHNVCWHKCNRCHTPLCACTLSLTSKTGRNASTTEAMKECIVFDRCFAGHPSLTACYMHIHMLAGVSLGCRAVCDKVFRVAACFMICDIDWSIAVWMHPLH